MRVAPFLVLAVLLLPAATAAGPSAAFTVHPGQSATLRLTLAKAATVGFALRADAAAARSLTVDGPGACDLETTATALGNGATLDSVRCALPAGTHTFTVAVTAGFAKGRLESSQGRWS